MGKSNSRKRAMTFCKSSRLFPVTRILSSWICDLTLIPEFLIAVLIFFAFSLSIPLIKSPYWRAVPPKAYSLSEK